MNVGSIEVICGGMFSGKTEELIRRLKRSQIARLRVQIFKPQIDKRYDEQSVVSHSGFKLQGIPVDSSADILRLVHDQTRVVGIDEAQFFDTGIVGVVTKLADRGVRVLIAGLDMDYLGKPFEPMPQLMAIAEQVTKVQAICVVCSGQASRSHRVVQGDERVMIGSSEYQPRCRMHHFISEATDQPHHAEMGASH